MKVPAIILILLMACNHYDKAMSPETKAKFTDLNLDSLQKKSTLTLSSRLWGNDTAFVLIKKDTSNTFISISFINTYINSGTVVSDFIDGRLCKVSIEHNHTTFTNPQTNQSICDYYINNDSVFFIKGKREGNYNINKIIKGCINFLNEYNSSMKSRKQIVNK